MKSADQLVGMLLLDRLAMEPRMHRLYAEDPWFHASLKIVQVTLIATVESGRLNGWTELEVDACVRGTLSRLLRDDLLYLAEERHILTERPTS